MTVQWIQGLWAKDRWTVPLTRVSLSFLTCTDPSKHLFWVLFFLKRVSKLSKSQAPTKPGLALTPESHYYFVATSDKSMLTHLLYNLKRLCMLSRFSQVRFCDPVDCSLPVPLSTGFSQQENWSRLPCPPPEDLPDPGIEPTSPALQAEFLLLSYQGSPLKWFRRRNT